MKLRRFGWILSLGTLVGAGCRSTSTQNQASQLVTPNFKLVTRDDLGREITLKAPASRVVCIGTGAIETIWALGEGRTLVGRDAFAGFPPEAEGAAKVPVAGDFNGPNAEKVAALQPDLLIVQGETYDRSRVELWQAKCGVPVGQIGAKTVDGVAADFEKIGAWLGREAQAKKLSQTLRQEGEPALAPVATIFNGPTSGALWTAGRGTLLDDVLHRAGWENAAKSVNGYAIFSAESLAAHPPDVYLVGQTVEAGKMPDRERALRELRQNPVLRDLPCIKAGRVIVVDSDLISRPGPRLAQGLKLLRSEALKLKNSSRF